MIFLGILWGFRHPTTILSPSELGMVDCCLHSNFNGIVLCHEAISPRGHAKTPKLVNIFKCSIRNGMDTVLSEISEEIGVPGVVAGDPPPWHMLLIYDFWLCPRYSLPKHKVAGKSFYVHVSHAMIRCHRWKISPPCLEPELFWVKNGPSGRRRANSGCFWVLCARGCKNTMPVTSDL